MFAGRYKIVAAVIIAVVVLVVFVVVAARRTKQETSSPEIKIENKNWEEIKRGVGFHTKNNIENDLSLANEVGLVILNAKAEGEKVPQVIRLGFGGGKLDYPVPNMAGDASDPEGLKQAYLELVRNFQPYYIGLGNEIERMEDKAEFARIYPGIYNAIKAECNSCIVYPVFQYESFDSALASSLPLDILALTSYPFSKYSNFNAIPSNYYDKAKSIANERSIKIAFTEIGWPTLPAFKSNAVDPQLGFYKRFKELTAELDIQFISWGLLYGESSAGEVWADMGLLNDSGDKKELFNAISSEKISRY